MDVFGRNDMSLLANLLAEAEKDEFKPKLSSTELNPASIVEQTVQKQEESPESHPPTTQKKISTEIWEEDEVPMEGYVDDSDTRITPLYDIVYKQAVTSEDIYLGISGNTPSLMSCEDILVKIKLPGTQGKEVLIETTDYSLDVRTPKFKLLLPIEHPIKREKSTAKWDQDKELLVVTIPLAREKLEML